MTPQTPNKTKHKHELPETKIEFPETKIEIHEPPKTKNKNKTRLSATEALANHNQKCVVWQFFTRVGLRDPWPWAALRALAKGGGGGSRVPPVYRQEI